MLAWLVMGALGATGITVDAGRGPVDVLIPNAAAGQPLPLVLDLHRYGSSSANQTAYSGLESLVDVGDFVYAVPQGETNSLGQAFWNATDYCCDVDGAAPDDVAYVIDLIDAIASATSVDPDHVTLHGHSNGGFLAHAVACAHADRIAAIASLAGANHLDPADCAPSEPVNVLQLHGTRDGVIDPAGGCRMPGDCYPSLLETVTTWRLANGCSSSSRGPTLDLDADVAGAETDIFYLPCVPGGAVSVWRMQDSDHIPALTADYAPWVATFLLAHPKP